MTLKEGNIPFNMISFVFVANCGFFGPGLSAILSCCWFDSFIIKAANYHLKYQHFKR